jgi:hypothetical protein
MEYIPGWVYERAWSGRSRACPKCASVFRSQFDRGQCPHCLHNFVASDVHGFPREVTVAEVVADELEAVGPHWCANEGLQPVEGFPIPAEHPTPALDEQSEWQWHRDWLSKGIEEGGQLYVWHDEGGKHGQEWYCVLKEGRLLAVMSTSLALWD